MDIASGSIRRTSLLWIHPATGRSRQFNPSRCACESPGAWRPDRLHRGRAVRNKEAAHRRPQKGWHRGARCSCLPLNGVGEEAIVPTLRRAWEFVSMHGTTTGDGFRSH